MRNLERTLLTALLAAGLAACVAACGAEAPPPEPTPTPAGTDRLRPLTSREGSPQPSFSPATETTLPPGHPPVSGETTGERPRDPGGKPAGQALTGTVVLSPKLQGQHPPTASLFLIVRSSASGQILAVRKEQNVTFPFAFQVSGADAMMEGTAFTGPFDVTARLSKTGDAMPTTGDIEGTAKKVPDGAKAVRITLDSVRP